MILKETALTKKICVVVQRYGKEVNGGAELLARLLAEHLIPQYEVHVATTKAKDHITWKNEYENDQEELNGIVIHRFPVAKERRLESFHAMNKAFFNGELDAQGEESWLIEQGPFSPQLVEYIADHKDDYDIFIFFTYLYYPTVKGLKEVMGKAIVIPTVHDEPYLSMSVFEDVFRCPDAILFNTNKESELIHAKFNNQHIPYRIGAAGVDVPEDINPERFKAKYHLDDFIIYVGRIDVGKNCQKLFDYFIRYKKEHPSELKLVLVGNNTMDIPDYSDIIHLGFVDEQDKFDGIAASKCLIMPSEFESLSLVVLEAMLTHTPVMVNGKCEVLKEHCLKSNGALYFENYLEFEKELHLILDNAGFAAKLSENGYAYASKNYSWDKVVENLDALISCIIAAPQVNQAS